MEPGVAGPQRPAREQKHDCRSKGWAHESLLAYRKTSQQSLQGRIILTLILLLFVYTQCNVLEATPPNLIPHPQIWHHTTKLDLFSSGHLSCSSTTLKGFILIFSPLTLNLRRTYRLLWFLKVFTNWHSFSVMTWMLPKLPSFLKELHVFQSHRLRLQVVSSWWWSRPF